MADDGDYHENFVYVAQALDLERLTSVLMKKQNEPRIKVTIELLASNVVSFRTLCNLLKNKVDIIPLIGLCPLLDELIADRLKENE